MFTYNTGVHILLFAILNQIYIGLCVKYVISSVEDLGELVERVVVAERLDVHELLDVRGAVDEPEVAPVEVLEQALAPELLQQRLVGAQRLELGMIDS